MRTLCGLIVVALLLAIPAAVFATTYDLIGGNPKNGVYVVGTVEITDDGSNLRIQYSVNDPWAWDLTATHVQVEADGSNLADALDQVPHTKGGPVPGQFDYNESSPEYQGGGLYIIPSPGNDVIILAHGVACENLAEPTMPSLPGEVEICVDYDYGIPRTAFLEITVSGGTSLDGTYGGYCAATALDISLKCYSAEVFSSYDPNIPASLLGMIIHPENLPLVNYMMNQDYVGKPSGPDGTGDPYTYADVQMAKWVLLEEGGQAPEDVIDPDDYDAARIGEILADVSGHEDYVPGCGDKIDILLFPYEIDASGLKVYSQPLEILIPVECGDCDTVWAGTVITLDPPVVNYPFPGKNWALYVEYTIGQGAPPRMSLDSSVTTTWGSIKNR